VDGVRPGPRATATGRLAAFVAGLTGPGLPPEVARDAKLHLLDALGCGLAAHALGIGGQGRAVAAEEGGAPAATVIGRRAGLPASRAALANAMLCHALDFDDTHGDAICHVTVVVGSAALAVAEAEGATGEALLAALVGGSEVVIRLGMAAGGVFHARGFHPTAVCGTFGAAAAAARLMRLDAPATVSALGIAGSLASGLLAFLGDGTPTKPIHAGWAAQAGVMAARLAAHGASGPAGVLEGRFGLYQAFTGPEDVDLEAQLGDLGVRWETPRIAYKPYPACHLMHGALGALGQAAAGRRFAPEEIAEVVVRVPKAAIPIVLEPAEVKMAPRGGYEGKFSLQYSAAALLVRGAVDVTTYAPPAMSDREVLALARRVRYEPGDFPTAGRAFPGAASVRLRDGHVLEAECLYQKGAPEHPLSPEDVAAKFRANAGLALPPDGVDALAGAVLGLEAIGDLRAAFRPLAEAVPPAV
jgi:2-methylcitrate dehydratase PrpD